MPGIPTHFKILELAIKKLESSSEQSLRDIAKILRDNINYAYLGVVGPALADFIPPDSPMGMLGGNQYLNLWKKIFGIVGDDMMLPSGLFTILKKMNGFLDKVEPIANAEDIDALKAMQGEVDIINKTAEDLKDVVEKISDIAVAISSAVSSGMKPLVNVSPGNPVPPPEIWTVRNFLFWKKTGKFAKALLDRAKASGDQAFQAYAYGYLGSYAALTCGSPFVNSIVGGPYRAQWWRNRWVDNYVDAWVHGYYEAGASMSGDTPSPGYDSWPNLCNAELHKKIELTVIDPVVIMKCLWLNDPFPNILPVQFGEFWVTAYEDAYGPVPDYSHVKPEALNGAYLLTWLVLWFQTSGKALGCISKPPMGPPSDCGDVPSWTNPAVAGDNGSGSTPPSPEIEQDPDRGLTASGIILIILGALFLFTGGLLPGAGAIAGGIYLIIEGESQIKWAKLRCDLYWYRLYLYNALKALHEVLTLGGFSDPYASELDDDQTALELMGIPFTFDSGKALTKSQGKERRYPAKPWSGALGTWIDYPRSFEQPYTVAYLTEAYPSFFVDDSTGNPLSNGEVRVAGQWPCRIAPGSNDPIQFGNTVDNIIDLFKHPNEILPDWNLDADRGLAFHTWQFKNGTYSDPVQIEPEP